MWKTHKPDGAVMLPIRQSCWVSPPTRRTKRQLDKTATIRLSCGADSQVPSQRLAIPNCPRLCCSVLFSAKSQKPESAIANDPGFQCPASSSALALNVVKSIAELVSAKSTSTSSKVMHQGVPLPAGNLVRLAS